MYNINKYMYVLIYIVCIYTNTIYIYIKELSLAPSIGFTYCRSSGDLNEVPATIANSLAPTARALAVSSYGGCS